MEKAQHTAEELYELGRDSIRRKRFDEAEGYLRHSLKEKQTANAWRALAVVQRAGRHLEKAQTSVREALTLNPRDDAALALLGELYFDGGDLFQSITHYVRAIHEAPGKLFYKQRFIALAGAVALPETDAGLKAAMQACLETPELDCSRAQILWYTLLCGDTDFMRLYKMTANDGYPAFDRASFAQESDLSPLLDPFFLLGVGKIVIYHPVFEDFLTCLRRLLLDDSAAAKPRFKPDEQVALGKALAAYCFYTEYIFETAADEDEKIAGLRQRLEAAQDGAAPPQLVALYGCYAPLHGLKNAAQVAASHGGGALAEIIGQQISDPARLRAVRDEIVTLTPIDDAVSVKVREQYEEFPYPWWKTFSSAISDEQAEGGLRGSQAKILVAGCGTGKEAIELAAVFPDAQVLAVDLSRMSLAYATDRARTHQVGNVTFRQADILKLKDVPGGLGPFDYISTSGVLHHLAQPLQGWAVLRGLLKDGGLMRVALYSRFARRHLSTAHKVIRDGHHGADAAGMKAFRRDSRRLLPPEATQDIFGRGDTYHLSMYRDLLFHSQEHQFDIPGIAAALDGMGLTFVKFGVTDEVLAAYRAAFPGDPEAGTLAHWHDFEQNNPDVFSAMYHFWCRAKPWA